MQKEKVIERILNFHYQVTAVIGFPIQGFAQTLILLSGFN